MSKDIERMARNIEENFRHDEGLNSLTHAEARELGDSICRLQEEAKFAIDEMNCTTRLDGRIDRLEQQIYRMFSNVGLNPHAKDTTNE